MRRAIPFLVTASAMGVLGCESPTHDPTNPWESSASREPRAGYDPGPPSSGPPVIAFVSTREGAPHIYLAGEDGLGVTRLTQGEAPAWSWDGQRIAFHRAGTDFRSTSIYVVNVDGSGLRHLGPGFHPSWSPDGRIAFNTYIWRMPGETEGGIMVMNPDGSDRRLLLSHDFAAAYNFAPGYGEDGVLNPNWSPDGRSIAFWLLPGYIGHQSVFLMDPDGSNPRNLQDTASGNESYPGNRADLTRVGESTFQLSTWGRPAWSPDGSKIAVKTGVGALIQDVETGERRIHPRVSDEPDWSPDGELLLFGRRRISVYHLESGWVGQLIREAVNPVRPDYVDYEAVWARAH